MSDHSTTTQVLLHRFAGVASDVQPFTGALRALASAAKAKELPGMLLTSSGDVLAVADNSGQLKTWCALHLDVDEAVDIEFEDDGWYSTQTAVFYVHQGRPFLLLRDGRLAITAVDVLPENAARVPVAHLDAFAHAAAEAIELHTAATL
jgi:hypothetical protein